MLSLDDNVPFFPRLKCPLINGLGRRPDGENRDESEGTASSGSAGASEAARSEGGGCGELGERELPAGEAAVEAVSRGRSRRTTAPQRGAPLESRPRREVSPAGAAASAGQVRRSGGRAFWSDAGGRALEIRGPTRRARRNAAAVDVGGRVVEPRSEERRVGK